MLIKEFSFVTLNYSFAIDKNKRKSKERKNLGSEKKKKFGETLDIYFPIAARWSSRCLNVPWFLDLSVSCASLDRDLITLNDLRALYSIFFPSTKFSWFGHENFETLHGHATTNSAQLQHSFCSKALQFQKTQPEIRNYWIAAWIGSDS